MILFVLPVAAVLSAIVFICFWPFLRKAQAQPNRFGRRRSAKNIGSAIAQGFNRRVDVKGRSSRLDVWSFGVFTAIMAATPIVIIILAVYADERSWTWSLLSVWLWPVLAMPSLTIAVRRLHDINRSGWWVLLLLAFGHFVLLYWFLQPSQNEAAELF